MPQKRSFSANLLRYADKVDTEVSPSHLEMEYFIFLLSGLLQTEHPSRPDKWCHKSFGKVVEILEAHKEEEKGLSREDHLEIWSLLGDLSEEGLDSGSDSD